jgi:hypothetical protein
VASRSFLTRGRQEQYSLISWQSRRLRRLCLPAVVRQGAALDPPSGGPSRRGGGAARTAPRGVARRSPSGHPLASPDGLGGRVPHAPPETPHGSRKGGTPRAPLRTSPRLPGKGATPLPEPHPGPSRRGRERRPLSTLFPETIRVVEQADRDGRTGRGRAGPVVRVRAPCDAHANGIPDPKRRIGRGQVETDAS